MTTVELAKCIVQNTLTLRRSPSKFEFQLAEAVIEAEAMANAYIKFVHGEICVPTNHCLCSMQVATNWLTKHAGEEKGM